MMKTRLNGTERPKKDAGGLRHGLLVLAVLLLTCVLMAGAVSAADLTSGNLGQWIIDRGHPGPLDESDGIITLVVNENEEGWQGYKAVVNNVNFSNNWVVEATLTPDKNYAKSVNMSLWIRVDGINDTIPTEEKKPAYTPHSACCDWSIILYTDKGWMTWDSNGSWESIDVTIPEAESYVLKTEYQDGTITQYINNVLVHEYPLDMEEFAGELTAPSAVFLHSYSYGDQYTATWTVPTVEFSDGPAYGDVIGVYTFDQLKEALAGDKTYIALAADIETNEEIVVNRAVTIDGNGYTISAGDTIPEADHLLEITKGPVTLKNLKLDSKGEAKGLNIHEPGEKITLTDLTLINSTGSGITINGADVSASGLTIAKSGWDQSIDVGISTKPSVSASTLTLTGTNDLQDTYQINSDNPNAVTIKADGYTIYDWYYWYMDKDTLMEYKNYKRTWTTNPDFATEVDIPKVPGSKAAVCVYNTESNVYALHQDIGNATTHFEAGDSVKQLQDIEVDAPITIDEAITFDGNGKKISGSSSEGYFLNVSVTLNGNSGKSVILQNLNLDISSIGSDANLGGITVCAPSKAPSVPVILKDSIVDMGDAGMTSTSMNPAVYFVNAPNSQITNNKITAGAASSSSTRCVVVDGGSDVTVSGNTLTLGSVSGTAVAVGVEIKGNDVDKVTVSGNTLNLGTNSGDTPRAVKITAKDTGSQKTFTVSKNDIQFGGKGTTVEVLLSTYDITSAANAQVKLNVEENTGSTASVVMLNKGDTNGDDTLLTSAITLTGNIYNPALTSSEEVAVAGGFTDEGSAQPNTEGVTHVNPAPQPVYSSGGNMNNAYRVLFNDGATTLSVQTDLSSGDKLTKPATPVKDGYTFAGWYKDSACTQAWDFETGIPGDMTLYAKWTAAGSSGETEATATPTKTATAVTTPQPTKTQSTTATTSAPQATTAAGVSPTLTQAPAPVAGALFGLLAAGVLLRRRFQ